jgi:hypothetical protein
MVIQWDWMMGGVDRGASRRTNYVHPFRLDTALCVMHQYSNFTPAEGREPVIVVNDWLMGGVTSGHNQSHPCLLLKQA